MIATVCARLHAAIHYQTLDCTALTQKNDNVPLVYNKACYSVGARAKENLIWIYPTTQDSTKITEDTQNGYRGSITLISQKSNISHLPLRSTQSLWGCLVPRPS